MHVGPILGIVYMLPLFPVLCLLCRNFVLQIFVSGKDGSLQTDLSKFLLAIQSHDVFEAKVADNEQPSFALIRVCNKS